jgi:hypothetical protein
MWALARSQSGVTLATQYPGMHAWRSLVGVASLVSLVLRHRPPAAGHSHDAQLHEQRLDRRLL